MQNLKCDLLLIRPSEDRLQDLPTAMSGVLLEAFNAIQVTPVVNSHVVPLQSAAFLRAVDWLLA